MTASLVLTAKIKTDAIWARIIRNCLLSLVARYIYTEPLQRARGRLPSAFILFKLQLYAAQKAEKLEISIEA